MNEQEVKKIVINQQKKLKKKLEYFILQKKLFSYTLK